MSTITAPHNRITLFDVSTETEAVCRPNTSTPTGMPFPHGLTHLRDTTTQRRAMAESSEGELDLVLAERQRNATAHGRKICDLLQGTAVASPGRHRADRHGTDVEQSLVEHFPIT